MKGMLKILMMGLLMMTMTGGKASNIPSSDRSTHAYDNVTPALQNDLSAVGLSLGAAVFIRIYKQSELLEVWVEHESGSFKLFRTYPICYFSGHLGPKLKEGDNQSPEGFYFVKPGQLNPWSQFHLSFNLGYPNAYDRAHGRTGSALMVHGSCVSVGCYAMTDAKIEEIYSLMVAAFTAGQPFIRVHVFPFVMNEENLNGHKNSPWFDFWSNLKTGHDYFVTKNRPPNVEVVDGNYVFD